MEFLGEWKNNFEMYPRRDMSENMWNKGCEHSLKKLLHESCLLVERYKCGLFHRLYEFTNRFLKFYKYSIFIPQSLKKTFKSFISWSVCIF